MIRHIVLFSFKEDCTQKEIDHLFLKLSQLRSIMPQIKSYSYGKNNSPEGLHQSFDYGMTMDFDCKNDRNFYLEHPEHQKIIKEQIKPNLRSHQNSVLVLDYEVNS